MQSPNTAAREEAATFWYGKGGAATAFEGAPMAGSAGAGHTALLAPGTQLVGRYRIQQPLGEGAFARVYAAWDGVLGRWVAAKIYPAETGGRISREEAQLQTACQHPNLMPLHDAGEDPLLGVAYLVMPLYPGADLAATLNRYGPMPFRTALLCIDQICSALEFLQQRRGIVHGDIKPANIWLTSSGAALLMDFNLPGLLARSDCLRAGTPGYTAPEALNGQMDGRSDVFSLGCVLYQCLTGTAPFAGGSAGPAGHAIPIERLRPEIRPELAAVVHRALAPNPEERFQTAREFQTALRRPLGGISRRRFATNAILRLFWRSLCMAVRLLAGFAGLLWRLALRFLRHAARHPRRALIELALCALLGGAAFRAAQAAALGWMAAHRAELNFALRLALGAGVAALSTVGFGAVRACALRIKEWRR